VTSLAPPWRVLLVDDEVVLRSLLRLMLQRTDRYQVVGEAGHGVEAIELAPALMPDLVLLDLSMPRMDGLEALPHLRRLVPDTRVIVFSGFSATGAAGAATRAGAHAYLEKGLEPALLLDALDAVMRT
jgi:DNA-binding NarL/FixJ family response regulator